MQPLSLQGSGGCLCPRPLGSSLRFRLPCAASPFCLAWPLPPLPLRPRRRLGLSSCVGLRPRLPLRRRRLGAPSWEPLASPPSDTWLPGSLSSSGSRLSWPSASSSWASPSSSSPLGLSSDEPCCVGHRPLTGLARP